MFYKYLFFFCFSLCQTLMAVTIEDLSKDRLIVSNSPELITSSGIVFDTLLQNESARLLYHHKNGVEKPLYVKIMIHNHSEEETSVSIQKGMGVYSRCCLCRV